jgi:hypothetical protein
MKEARNERGERGMEETGMKRGKMYFKSMS